MEEHRKWLRWLEQRREAIADGHKEPHMPPPSFKDCQNCHIREDCASEQERREWCSKCPLEAGSVWDTLPPTPSERYHVVSEWANLPIEAHDLSDWNYQDLRDLETMRRSRSAF